MADILLRAVGADGAPTQESAGQLLARILFDLGDGPVTLPEALRARPTQDEVREALEGLEAGDVDLGPLQRAVEGALAAAQDAAAGSVRLGGIVGLDADWTIPPDAVHVVIPPLTASRTWSLPDVDTYPRGQDLVIVDEGGFLGAGLTLTLIPLAGSDDTIPSQSDNRITLSSAGAAVRLRRGVLSNAWVVV